MPLFDAARMAWEAVCANKLRSALTLLGIVIGVFSIIASVTAVDVIDVYFDDTVRFLGSNTFTVQKYPAINVGRIDENIRNRPDISYDQYERLKRSAYLPVAVSPTDHFSTARVEYRDLETDPNVRVLGADEQWPANNSYTVHDGRFLTDADVQFARAVVVLGADVAEDLFPSVRPVGKEIAVDGFRFRVIGVLERKGSAFGESQDNLVVAPITRMLSLYGSANRSIDIEVRVSDVSRLEPAQGEVIGHLRTIRKVPPGAPNDFELVTNEGLLDAFSSFTRYLTLGGAAVGFIALLAAGVGVMNIMLVSVTERTREIGIRKSVGATSGAILKQFLLETVVLCQVGGLIGIALGVLGGNVVSLVFDIRPAFPWEWAAGGILGMTVIALVFGVYPAYKAAQLDPIESLRYE